MAGELSGSTLEHEQSPPLRSDPQSLELRNSEPLEFAPSPGSGEPYPEDHPARIFLGQLVSTEINPTERSALKYYATNHGQQEIKTDLSQGYTPPIVRRIDDVMRRTTLPCDIVVFRGKGPNPSDPSDFLPGEHYSEPTYTSTTLDATLARSWQDSQTVQRIVVPKGTPVAVPSLHEAEILLPRGSDYEIDGAKTSDDYTLVYSHLIAGSPLILREQTSN